MHYLDNAATTAVAPLVADEADRVLRTHFANPSSLYAPGFTSELIINEARKTVAASLGATAGEIVFTSCGSESNNLAIMGAVKARAAWANHIVVTGYEHPSVQNPVKALQQSGWQVSVVHPTNTGFVDIETLADAVTPKTALVTAMHVNNEIGTILEVAKLAERVKACNNRTAVHIDGVQAWGKVPIALSRTAIDTYAVSGHKIHAPKGVGALYVRKGFHMGNLLYGGAQESRRRPGTENIAYIAAMAKAISLLEADKDGLARTQALANLLWQRLDTMPGIVRNSPKDAFCGVANFSLPGIKSETMLHFLESKGVYVSSGSACSKGEPSHTLTAMSLPKARIDTALRVSFGTQNTPEDIEALCSALAEGMQTLAKMRR